MSYEPTTWKTGDVITANKLNKIKQGIAAIGDTPVVTDHPIMVVPISTDVSNISTLGNTWQEIHDAYVAGKFIILAAPGNSCILNAYSNEYNGNYVVEGTDIDTGGISQFIATSANGYPTQDGETPK